MNIRQHKIATPERGETNEVSPLLVSAWGEFPGCSTGNGVPAASPHREDGAGSLGRPKQLEFTRQKTEEKRALQRDSFKDLQRVLLKPSTEY